MKRGQSLLQLAYAVKAGNKKLEDLPKRQQNRVKAMASSMTKDQLEVFAKPAERERYYQFSSERTRNARTA